MKKDGKRITRWKTGANKLQGAAYLRDMAEQGWILEDMNHLMYTFREDAPQYLKYRILERDCVLAAEEREAYEKDGWTEVCHYELEYVFVKERDPFAEDDAEENKEEILKDLEQKIEQEEKNERNTRLGQLLVMGFGLIAAFMAMGFSEGTMIFTGRMLIRFLPWILIAYFASKRRTKSLRQEQEKVREGDIPEDYADWRKSRKVTLLFVLVLVFGLGVWVYYKSDFNEKTFDMPKEVSYVDIPAVRLEKLMDEPMTRAGDSIDPEMEGIRLNANMGEGSMYTWKKNMGGFENYGVDHRFLPRTKEKVETHQCMKTVDGAEYELDTMYYHFRDVQDAGSEYIGICADEEYWDAHWKEEGMEFPERHSISMESDKIANVHACKEEWAEGTAYHLVCMGMDNQVMELDFRYSHGEVSEKRLLKEIEKVFTAQVNE